MYGEADKDGFLYRITDPSQLATLGGDTIHGFQTGIDKIELSSLLDEFVIDPTTALAGGYVVLKVRRRHAGAVRPGRLRWNRPAHIGDRR